MNYYFLTHNIMTKKAEIITALATATALSMAPLSADTNNQTEQQKIDQKEVSKKVKQVTCSTKLACEALSYTIQAQIDKLEAKGNLTKDEKRLRYNLRKELIAVEKLETAQKDKVIAVEKSETADNEKTITTEEFKTREAYSKIQNTLSSIEGSL